jgi:hypothetical protein
MGRGRRKRRREKKHKRKTFIFLFTTGVFFGLLRGEIVIFRREQSGKLKLFNFKIERDTEYKKKPTKFKFIQHFPIVQIVANHLSSYLAIVGEVFMNSITVQFTLQPSSALPFHITSIEARRAIKINNE